MRVLQTCLDLIKAGYDVHLVADAVASRVTRNRDIAIDLLSRFSDRMRAVMPTEVAVAITPSRRQGGEKKPAN